MGQLRSESYPGHQCRCTLGDPDDDGVTSSCTRIIWNPDQAVCDGCLAMGHMALLSARVAEQ